MRLAFCNATRRWGGVKTWSIEFAAALRDRGHDVTLYGRDPAFVERACAAGLPAFAVNFGFDYSPSSIRWFYREFQDRGVEAVLVNVGKDLRTAGAAARLLDIPLVQRIGLPGDMKNSLSVRTAHRLLRPHYLCPCVYIRDGMLRNLPFLKEEETDVVYSAKRALPEAPAGANSPLRLLSTSQVNANKGHIELAYTLAALRREGFDLRWEVAGVGDALERLRALCVTLGLDRAVTFHGFLQDLTPLLRSSDVFVLSSYTEGLPNTLLEAMANGLVPVARSVGGVQECLPPALAMLSAPFSGWERKADWADAAVGDLPLYAPLKAVLAAPTPEVIRYKQAAWEHCSRHFSLAAQAARLEAFFLSRIAAATGR